MKFATPRPYSDPEAAARKLRLNRCRRDAEFSISDSLQCRLAWLRHWKHPVRHV
jgi:hypothetical protein